MRIKKSAHVFIVYGHKCPTNIQEFQRVLILFHSVWRILSYVQTFFFITIMKKELNIMTVRDKREFKSQI